MRLPPAAWAEAYAPAHVLRDAGWLTAYALLSLLAAELFVALASGFDVYRPLDLNAGAATGLVCFLLVEYLLLREVSRAAATWLQEGKRATDWLWLVGAAGAAGLVYGWAPTVLPGVCIGALAASALLVAGGLRRAAPTAVGAFAAQTIFGAAVVASALLATHEIANAGRHERYARALADPRDRLAEREIAHLARDFDLEAARADPAAYWERSWLAQDYLASNYYFAFEPDSTRGPFGAPGDLQAMTHTFGFDWAHAPQYRVKTPLGHTIALTLNRDFRHSAYAAGLPYMGLDRLARYHYVVVDGGEIRVANASTFDLAVLDVALPPVGTFARLEHGDFDGAVYRHDADTYVLIGEPLPEAEVAMTVFAVALCLLLLIGAAVELAPRLRRWRHFGDHWRALPLQVRIPGLVLGSTLLLFGLVAVATAVFLVENNAASTYERQLSLARSVRNDLRGVIRLASSTERELAPEAISPAQLRTLFERRLVDIDVYTETGALLTTSFASRANTPASQQLDRTLARTFVDNPWAIVVREVRAGRRTFVRTYFGLSDGGALQRVVALNTPRLEAGTAQDIPVIMGKLLVVYVGVLLVAWLGGLVLIEMLAGPLLALADRMQAFQLGDSPEPIAWAGDDGFGRLVAAYNAMVAKLDASTRALVEREREGAWQVMAQQIAHEINNTLTPLRLNAQYLTMTLARVGGPEVDGPRRMASGMIDRIDHLSQVAAQFQAFAQLDTPHPTPTRMRELLGAFVAERREHAETQVRYVDSPGADQLVCLIDPHHFLRVLSNLVDNAERAIPAGRLGQVAIRLQSAGDRVVVEVRDNGTGIPAELHPTIFDPKFSTTSSQTGLGLPVSKRIVEYFGGEMSFETTVGAGTTFRILLPVPSPASVASLPFARLAGRMADLPAR